MSYASFLAEQKIGEDKVKKFSKSERFTTKEGQRRGRISKSLRAKKLEIAKRIHGSSS